MKTLRNMMTAALLACVLALSVNAGDMYTGYAPTPPPEQTVTSNDATEETGEIVDITLDTLATLLSSLLTAL